MRFHLGSSRCGTNVQQRLEPNWLRMKMKMKMKMMMKTEREKERERETTGEKKTVACAEVETGAFKALAGSAPTKTWRSNSLVDVSRRVQRDRKKRVHVRWSITSGAQNGPPVARTHAKHLRMNPVVHAFQRFLGRDRAVCALSWSATRAGTGIGALPAPTLATRENEWAQVWRTWRPCEQLDFALFQERLGSSAGV